MVLITFLYSLLKTNETNVKMIPLIETASVNLLLAFPLICFDTSSVYETKWPIKSVLKRLYIVHALIENSVL